ncbi:MAG: oligosaccharide flippase family protein [Oscillospiraceae bacterium]|nr:oligosaccharide flippase family protein [Oscillospiraceae bacterium]
MGDNAKMSKSRRKNAILNISIGYVAQIGILILSFVGRRIFLNYLSVDYLGVNGLYSNVLTILSLAELGLDTAVLYSLYKPVADDNKPLINSLVKYFKKIYSVLAGGVFLVGIMLIPFLKYIINSELPQQDLIIFYVLFLMNTVASYFVAHKVALLSAYQEQRIPKMVSLGCNLLLQVIHIIVLIIWQNYYAYIIATVLTTIVNNTVLGIVCNRIHHDVFEVSEVVTFDKKPIFQRIFSTFLYKIGAVLINSTDNILISVIVSTTAVGLYSNYYTIIAATQGFIAIITTSLISGIGNLCANGNKERQHELFNMLLLFYHFLGAVGFIGFYLLFNNVILIWLGEQYLFDQWTVFIIALNFYLTNAISPIWMYREANGIFDQVKYLILIRALINIVLSVVLGLLWGVFGIFAATAISLLLTSFWYEPKILFGNVFKATAATYWLKQLKYFLLSVISFGCSFAAIYFLHDGFFMLIIKIMIVCIISALFFGVTNIKSSEFQTLKELLIFRR